MSFWSPGMTLESIEKIAIIQAIGFYRGNKNQTAISLGIAVRTLDAKLEKYGHDDEVERLRFEADKARREAISSRMRGITPASEAPREARPPINGSPSAGIRMESIANSPTQHALPLSESKEVQDVLSAKHAASGKGRRG